MKKSLLSGKIISLKGDCFALLAMTLSLRILSGLVGVDFRQSRKSTPTNPQYTAKARHCERSEAIPIY
jgi:hypothetical protein